MKFTINIECTPEEARDFMGLPDPAQMQEHFMKALSEKVPEMPEGMADSMKYWQDFQKMMWAQMTTPMGAPSDGAPSSNKKK